MFVFVLGFGLGLGASPFPSSFGGSSSRGSEEVAEVELVKRRMSFSEDNSVVPYACDGREFRADSRDCGEASQGNSGCGEPSSVSDDWEPFSRLASTFEMVRRICVLH
jgi:hypothetical protein